MSLHHVALEAGGQRWVYQVPVTYAGTRDEILKHGVLVATRFNDVWQIGGTCVIRDVRYREILDNTPVLKEVKP